MRFLFDNQLAPHLAEAVHALTKVDGHEAIHLRKKFPPNTKDIDWITTLGAEGGWIVICGDLDIIRTRAERPIWKAAGLVGFFLRKGWMHQTPWEQAWRLIRWWPTIVKQAEIATPGNAYGVQVNFTGKLEVL